MATHGILCLYYIRPTRAQNPKSEVYIYREPSSRLDGITFPYKTSQNFFGQILTLGRWKQKFSLGAFQVPVQPVINGLNTFKESILLTSYHICTVEKLLSNLQMTSPPFQAELSE